VITAAAYWRGRDIAYANELTRELRMNAGITISLANDLLELFHAANPKAAGRDATSGWRPPSVNQKVGGSKKSLHMSCQAVDIEDRDRAFSKWLMTPAGQKALVQLNLYIEDPAATPTWVHVQIVPPKSGKRVYKP
jgi:hypothetical protein